MLIIFWLSLLLLVLIALSFIVWPLLKRSPAYRPSKLSFWLAISIIIIFPLMAFNIYWKLGASTQLAQYWAFKQDAQVIQATLKKVKNHPQLIINQLKSHLKRHPNSAKGWFLLGRLYLGRGEYPQAYNALTKAHHLKPEKTSYTIIYAQAEFFSRQQHLLSSTRKLLEPILKAQPNSIATINLLALNAYRSGQYQQAVNYWERMLPMFTTGSRDQKILLTMIAAAQKVIQQQ